MIVEYPLILESVIACDGEEGCDLNKITIQGDYKDAVQWLKDNNWKFEKVNKEWSHYCLDCQKIEGM